MPKIITVTANTAIDLVITTQNLALGDTAMAKNSLEFAAGKGINVAKTLASLQHPAIALGFVGQQSLAAFTALNSPFLQTDFTAVSGKTRTNITLHDQPSGQETHIRTTGYSVTDLNCQHLIAQLNAYVQTDDIVILSGSLPTGAPIDFYKTLITLCHTQGARTFLDSSGEALKTAIAAQPYLIKPNHHELAELIGYPLKNDVAIIQAAHQIIDQGVHCVVVSRGRQGAIAVTAHQALNATIMQDIHPVINSIGCGDAMTGGLALATLQHQPLSATLTFAIACGTANLFTPEPGQFDQSCLNTLYPHINCTIF